LLNAYDWPGNVRQLENAVFRAVVLADSDELTTAEFPQIAAQVDGFDVRIPPVPTPVQNDAAAPHEDVAHFEPRDPNVMRLIDDTGDVRKLWDIEAETIRFALAHYHGQMSQMARKLGIGRSTLYRKMKDIGVDGDVLGEDVDEAAA
jgi:DNA-binding NtrC family response regulator